MIIGFVGICTGQDEKSVILCRCLPTLSIMYLSVYLSIYLSLYLSIYLSIYVNCNTSRNPKEWEPFI